VKYHKCKCGNNYCHVLIPDILYRKWRKLKKGSLIHCLYQSYLTKRTMKEEITRLKEVQMDEIERLMDRIRYLEEHSGGDEHGRTPDGQGYSQHGF
jgi:hypothetical protein